MEVCSLYVADICLKRPYNVRICFGALVIDTSLPTMISENLRKQTIRLFNTMGGSWLMGQETKFGDEMKMRYVYQLGKLKAV